MERANNEKALFIVVNAGFADEAVEIARGVGAKGATILNARGIGAVHKSIMGITIDTEREMVLILAEKDTADKIMTAIKEKAGLKTPADGICFTMPVEKITGEDAGSMPSTIARALASLLVAFVVPGAESFAAHACSLRLFSIGKRCRFHETASPAFAGGLF